MQSRLTISADAVPKLGGQGLNLYHMIEASRETFDLSVFCRATYPGIKVKSVPAPRASLINRVPLLRRLRDWQVFFGERHFDSYVARNLNGPVIFHGMTGQCAKSLQVARQRGARTLLDVVTTHVEDFGAQQDCESAKFNVRPTLHPLQRKRILREYQGADLIRTMSESARRTFLERGFSSDRVVTIPPPINFAEFTAARFDEPKFRISFVGLIEPWKGFHYLIEAFNALNVPDSELVLWGGPGARPISRYLREQMAGNPKIVIRPVEVRRLGYAEVYTKSSVLVHPSLSDGFGYVVAEAMASGIPVIVTRNTGASDLVVDGQNGYVVPPGDRDAIRDRLFHLMHHPGLLREMGRAARETARSLTFEKFRHRYVSCLNSLAA